MAVNAASLMVRIGCDAQAFSHGLTKLERDATRGFNTIRKAGEEMAIGVTAPILLLGGVLVKMAAEAEDASARVDRVFGDMASTVKKQLKDMAGVIPETDEALQGMAVKSDNMLQGLGYGAEKAAKLSVNMVKLAGDMAAFAHVPVGEALDALDKGLAGKTRGLIQFGIVVSADQIKLEAMRRGLLDNHRTLTELGTAEISEMLIRQAATRITGEAERVAGQAGSTFKFLKRDVEELGDKIGGLLLPSMVSLAHSARSLVDSVSGIDPVFMKFVLAGAAAATTIAPLLIMIGNLSKAFMTLRTAMAMASGMGAAGAIFGAMISAPFTAIIAGIGGVTLALYGLYKVYQLLSDAPKPDGRFDLSARNFNPSTRQFGEGHAGGSFAGAMAGMAGKKAPAKDGKLSEDNRDALNVFKAHAALVQDQYQNAVEVGGDLVARMASINALHSEAVGLLAQQNGKWTDMAKAAADVARATQGINDVGAVAGALGRGTATPQLLGEASRTATSDAAINLGLAKKAIDDETSLRTREAALLMQDTFNATREATAQMGEQIRRTKNDLDFRASLLKLDDHFDAAGEAAVQFGEQLRSAKNDLALRAAALKLPNAIDAAGEAGVEALEQMRRMYTDLAKRAEAVRIGTKWDDPRANARVELGEEQLAIARNFALRFEKLLAPFDAFRERLGNVSDAMQAAAVTIFDVAVNLAQSLAQQIAGKGKGAGIGGMIGSLFGGALAGAKFGAIFGPIGAALGGIAGALAGSLFDHPKKAADQAASSLATLAVSANALTSALLNVPQGFKVALAQWRAQIPQEPVVPPGGRTAVPRGTGTGGGGGGSGSGGGSGGTGTEFMPGASIVFNITESKNAKETARAVLGALRSAAVNAYGDSTRWPDLMVI